MDENNPLEIDPRPNRRKDKDNPYTIFTVGIKTDSPHYFVQFKDNAGNERCLEIDKDLFELLDRFELEDFGNRSGVFPCNQIIFVFKMPIKGRR